MATKSATRMDCKKAFAFISRYPQRAYLFVGQLGIGAIMLRSPSGIVKEVAEVGKADTERLSGMLVREPLLSHHGHRQYVSKRHRKAKEYGKIKDHSFGSIYDRLTTSMKDTGPDTREG